jgi:hypothetical protein
MKKITIRHYLHSTSWHKGIKNRLPLLVTILLLGTFFISQNVFSQAGTANVVAPVGGMKLDGYLQRQTGVGDWLKGAGALNGAGTYLFNDDGTVAAPYNGAAYSGLIFHKMDLFNDANDEGFDGGNKLFHDPNTWGWSSKKQLNKDDMNHSMVFITRDNNDHIWVLISGDRASENGTSYLDFEFYKNEIIMTGPNQTGAPVLGGKGGFLSSGPNGGRTVGDLSVTLSFTAGGSVAGVSFLQWAPANCDGCFDYVPLEPDAGEAWVAANTVIVNVPYEAFGLTTYAPNLFIEAAIDVTALIGSGTGDQCAGLNFKSLFIKTKSSAERTADLKDFIAPFSISLCGDRVVPGITATGDGLSLGCNPSSGQIEGALGSATASDNCAAPTLSSSDGSVISNGCNRSKTRTWVARDFCGNTSTTSRTAVWVADGAGPSITTGGNNAALGCNPSGAAIDGALGTATASDACGAVTLSQTNGSVSSTGCSRSQTRTWTARDACGNTSSTSRTANWTAASALTITCPADIQLQCTDASTSTANTGVAVPSGGCSPTVSSSDQATTKNCAKLIKRTWIATDACGQTATCVQNIYIVDNTPPVITCHAAAPATATDNCSSPGNILIFLSNGVWTAIDESGNISTLNCNGARLAPTTNVVEETKPVVTEDEKVTSANRQLRQLPAAAKGLEVYAYPNPYTDEVNFRFVSPQSGIGKLELYDMAGRQVKTLNLGNVQAGVQRSVNYKIPSLNRFSMIYKLTVGDQAGNGTLIAGSKEP